MAVAPAANAASKARLHCCGGTHHDHSKPAGVDLDLHGTLCYGTGDNLDAAVLLLPGDDEDLGWQDLHMRLLADKIARGANVTVLVPYMLTAEASVGTRKRQRDKQDTINAKPLSVDAVNALATHLGGSMSVSHIAVIGLFGHGAEVCNACASAETATQLYKCSIVATFASQPAGELKIPTMSFSLNTAGEQTITESPIALRQIPTDADAEVFRTGSGAVYESVMRDLLFWCKKHLHEWS